MAEASHYARLAPGADNDTLYTGDLHGDGSIPLTPRSAPARAAKTRTKTTKTAPARGYLPSSRRFWADFTMGFADGLTVPFALTAGLSSLGQTDTVVYAGLAEVSAGCISMGIGGYLSARQSSTAPGGDEEEDDEDADVEALPPRDDREKNTTKLSPSTVASRYLAPLRLPADLQQLVMAHVATQPGATDAILAAESPNLEASEHGYCDCPNARLDGADPEENDDDYVWPVASGLSVALGYVIGGMLPLWPYFFVERVGDGLRWSFAVCIVALFLFGFIRDFALDTTAAADSRSRQTTSARQLSWHRPRIPWRRLWKSTFEGLQMVILGGIAAMAAVLCVRMFESEKST